MAYLVDPDGRLIYLADLHTIGRLPQGVDTVINQPEISRYHAAIEWHDNAWWIRDMSLNGSWYNKEKLVKNIPHKLQVNAEIRFGDIQSRPFIVNDLSEPEDILLRCENVSSFKTHKQPSSAPKIIYLNTYHLLPNEDHPEVAVYCKNNRWIMEELNNNEAVTQILQNKDTVCFNQQYWQVHLTSADAATVPLQNAPSVNEAILIFKLSLDEETTHISVATHEHEYNLYVRSHHYMTLVLARQLAEDIRRGLDKTEQGWIYSEVLAQRLGIEDSHLNIQIHRARKQFSELRLQSGNTEQFIERRPGQIRLNCQQFKIYKGDNLESSSKEFLTDNASTA